MPRDCMLRFVKSESKLEYYYTHHSYCAVLEVKYHKEKRGELNDEGLRKPPKSRAGVSE